VFPRRESSPTGPDDEFAGGSGGYVSAIGNDGRDAADGDPDGSDGGHGGGAYAQSGGGRGADRCGIGAGGQGGAPGWLVIEAGPGGSIDEKLGLPGAAYEGVGGGPAGP
jgi:hypothetical protein